MKFNSLFLSIISLTTVSFLVNIHPASAKKVSAPVAKPAPAKKTPCTGSDCPIYIPGGIVGDGTIPEAVRKQLNDLIAKGNFTEAEIIGVQFLKQAERTQDINGQAAAHQVLADLYERMGKLDLASSHLKNAGVLYNTLGNAQGSSEVQLQLRQIQPRQIQLQRR